MPVSVSVSVNAENKVIHQSRRLRVLCQNFILGTYYFFAVIMSKHFLLFMFRKYDSAYVSALFYMLIGQLIDKSMV